MTINSKDKRDVYYFMSKQNNYRARSVYKLIHINEKYNIFNSENANVLDLCAAPGSWSQYLSELVKNKKLKKVVAVDLQDMVPIENVEIHKADITDKVFIDKISQYNINVVICDGAPDVTGYTDIDLYAQLDLIKACLSIVLKINKNSNNSIDTFVTKIFRNTFTKYVVRHFKKYFGEVFLTKPRASRNNSTECFMVCRNFRNSGLEETEIDFTDDIEEEPMDVCGYGEPDPDFYVEEIVRNENYKNSKPIDAPYNEIVEKKRNL